MVSLNTSQRGAGMEPILRQKLRNTRHSTVHGFMPHELISFGLPARRTTARDWVRRNGDFKYTVTAGEYHGVKELPSGKYARAALLFLCTQAKLTGDPVLKVTQSYRGFINGLGMDWQGAERGAEALKQLVLVSKASFQIEFVGDVLRPGEEHIKSEAAFFSESLDLWVSRSELSTVKESTVVLSPLFMRKMERAVPISMKSWRWLLGHTKSPLALDIYLWLCGRLYRCEGHARVTWNQLYDQFGSTAPLKRFKQQFREALQVALQVYPEAQIREDIGTSRTSGFKGFHLFPSPDPRDSRTPDELQLVG